MKVFALPLFMLAVCPLYAAPAIAGPWTIAGDIQGYQLRETCTFTQDSSKLAGICKLEGKSYDATGTVDEKKVTFTHGGEYQGEKLTITYTATFAENGTLAGAIEVQPMQASGTFTAKKLDEREE